MTKAKEGSGHHSKGRLGTFGGKARPWQPVEVIVGRENLRIVVKNCMCMNNFRRNAGRTENSNAHEPKTPASDSIREYRLLHGCKVTVRVRRRNAHGSVGLRWRWGWAVRGTSRTGIILAASPRQAYARVANRIALHLVDGHFSRVALDKLDETTSFARRNLDIGNLAEALEERAEFVLGDIAGKATNEDGGVVWVSKLIHRLRGTIEAHGRGTHWIAHANVASHGHATWPRGGLVLRSGSGNAHRTVSAVDTLHLGQSTLLITFISEPDKSVATRHAGDWIRHDLRRFSGLELVLEQRHQNIFIDFRAKIAYKDRVFRATIITALVSKPATRSPVELENTVGVWDHAAVEAQGFSSSLRVGEIHEAVPSVTAGELVTDHLDIHILTHAIPQTANEGFVNPGFKLAHPECSLGIRALGFRTRTIHIRLLELTASTFDGLASVSTTGRIVLFRTGLALEILVIRETHNGSRSTVNEL